jgi:parvulin-like peptidyl-prolyl isomerase
MKFVKKRKSARAIAIAAVLILILTFLASCSGGKAKADGSAAVLVINGQTVSRKYLDEMAELYRMQQLAVTPEAVFEANSVELRQSAARQVVANMLMLKVVGSNGWEADTAAVNAMANGFVAQFGGRKAFLKWLSAMGESEKSMRKGMAEELMIDSLLKTVTALSSLDESELRAYYEENMGRYVLPGRVRASQIVFTVDGASPEASLQIPVIMEKANEALAKAKAGEDFDALVKAYSSMPGDGDMGWFKKGDLIPDLERTLFSLKVGEVSTLLPSSMGIHILKKTGEEDSRQMAYEEVADGVRRSLETEKKRKAVNGYIDSLIAVADIKFIDPELAFEVNRGESLSLPRLSD